MLEINPNRIMIIFCSKIKCLRHFIFFRLSGKDCKMERQKVKKIKFYLYNYYEIDNLINKRRKEIIDAIKISNNAWLKSKTSEGFTLEDQVIKLDDDFKIIEYKRWQVFLKEILVFLCKKYPRHYQYLVLKYLENDDVEEISKLLKIDFKEMITLNNKLMEMIYKKAKNRNMV